jgi:hypothetical protein
MLDSDLKVWGAGYGNKLQRCLEDMYWVHQAYKHARGYDRSAPKWDMAGGHEFEGRMALLGLLVTKRASEASDSRDIVFAVAGIAMSPKFWGHGSLCFAIDSLNGVFKTNSGTTALYP